MVWSDCKYINSSLLVTKFKWYKNVIIVDPPCRDKGKNIKDTFWRALTRIVEEKDPERSLNGWVYLKYSNSVRYTLLYIDFRGLYTSACFGTELFCCFSDKAGCWRSTSLHTLHNLVDQVHFVYIYFFF